jgi:hypothetical protein
MAKRKRKLTAEERERLRADLAEVQRELREVIDLLKDRLGQKS